MDYGLHTEHDLLTASGNAYLSVAIWSVRAVHKARYKSFSLTIWEREFDKQWQNLTCAMPQRSSNGGAETVSVYALSATPAQKLPVRT